jgi:hypothetical protein
LLPFVRIIRRTFSRLHKSFLRAKLALPSTFTLEGSYQQPGNNRLVLLVIPLGLSNIFRRSQCSLDRYCNSHSLSKAPTWSLMLGWLSWPFYNILTSMFLIMMRLAGHG